MNRFQTICSRAVRVVIVITLLCENLLPSGASVRAEPAAPASGGTFTVISTGDNTYSDINLTLREAILLANGGTGGDGSTTGLGRALTAGERAQLSGCTFDAGGNITGGCGAGFPDTIRFAAFIRDVPTIHLALSSGVLPALNDTQPTTLDGTVNDVYPIIDTYYTCCEGIVLQSNNNVVKGIQVTNGVDGIVVNGSNNLLSGVDVIGSSDYGMRVNGSNNLLSSVGLWIDWNGMWVQGDSNVIDSALVGVGFITETVCAGLGSYDTGIVVRSGSNNQIKNSYIGCNGRGETRPGIHIESVSGGNNLIGPNNHIGTNATRSASLSNSGNGVELYHSGDFVISNTIMNNLKSGVYVLTSTNTIAGNFINSNLSEGILLDDGSQNNIIGGPIGGDPYGGNTIVNNSLDGVKIYGANTSGNQLVGNFIGLLSNLSVQGNLRDGVLVDGGAHDNRIGVLTYTANIIAGNHLDGVAFTTSAHHNLVEHNYIGTDGLFAKPNLGNGILINSGAHDNTIGTNAHGNFIDFNGQNGVIITGTTTATNAVGANVIYANTIDGVGVGSGAFNNWVSTGSCCPNTINANGRHGVNLFSGAHDNLVTYNDISSSGQSGVNLDGTNTADNEVLHASIHDNTGIGIKETNNAANNWWTQISTYNNGGLGIDKASGTPIHPTIQSVTRIGNAWTISGTATASIVLNPVSVEVYLVAADPSGFGEGKTYLGSASVDGFGNWSMNSPEIIAACFSTFETRSSLVTGISASSDFSQNKCIGSFIYLPLIRR